MSYVDEGPRSDEAVLLCARQSDMVVLLPEPDPAADGGRDALRGAGPHRHGAVRQAAGLPVPPGDAYREPEPAGRRARAAARAPGRARLGRRDRLRLGGAASGNGRPDGNPEHGGVSVAADRRCGSACAGRRCSARRWCAGSTDLRGRRRGWRCTAAAA